MPWKDETRRRQKDVNYYYTHQEQKIANAARWNREHPERVRKTMKKWRSAHADDVKRRNMDFQPRSREMHKIFRHEAIVALGAKCIRCGFDDERALQFNHISGDGYKERETIGKNYKTWLKSIAAGKRPDIELTCANCNMIHARENGFYNRARIKP